MSAIESGGKSGAGTGIGFNRGVREGERETQAVARETARGGGSETVLGSGPFAAFLADGFAFLLDHVEGFVLVEEKEGVVGPLDFLAGEPVEVGVAAGAGAFAGDAAFGEGFVEPAAQGGVG